MSGNLIDFCFFLFLFTLFQWPSETSFRKVILQLCSFLSVGGIQIPFLYAKISCLSSGSSNKHTSVYLIAFLNNCKSLVCLSPNWNCSILFLYYFILVLCFLTTYGQFKTDIIFAQWLWYFNLLYIWLTISIRLSNISDLTVMLYVYSKFDETLK